MVSSGMARSTLSPSKSGNWMNEKGRSSMRVAPRPLYSAPQPPCARTVRTAAAKVASCVACIRILSCSAGTRTTQLTDSPPSAATLERAAPSPSALRRLASPLMASYVAKKEAAAGTAGTMAAEMPRHKRAKAARRCESGGRCEWPALSWQSGSRE